MLLLSGYYYCTAQTKIIDMHMHSYSDNDFGERAPATDHYGNRGSKNAEEHRIASMAAMKKWNIVKAVVSGNPESVDNWVANDSSHQLIRGILIFNPGDVWFRSDDLALCH